jgi:hypothetical protein
MAQMGRGIARTSVASTQTRAFLTTDFTDFLDYTDGEKGKLVSPLRKHGRKPGGTGARPKPAQAGVPQPREAQAWVRRGMLEPTLELEHEPSGIGRMNGYNFS